MKYRHIFGPIASRRLGRSLGINLTAYKVCSMDCIYCEAGATTRLTGTREEFFPAEEVIAEIDSYMAGNPAVDFLTYSGTGEPLLYSRFGEIAKHISTRYTQYRQCLITNSLSLTDRDCAREASWVDLIIPSLDGSDDSEFAAVNRPVPGVSVEDIVEALADFRNKYPAVEMWLEIFIIPGINDSPDSIERFKKHIARIKPAKVQLNTLDRKGVVDWITIPPVEKLLETAEQLGAVAPTEIIGKTSTRETIRETSQ